MTPAPYDGILPRNPRLLAQNADWGPIQHQGEMHGRASYRYCWDVLRKAKSCGVTLPAAAAAPFFA